ncbi:MAG: hypothetical protein ACJ74Y_04145 [Bryobacteraceae bacterium]
MRAKLIALVLLLLGTPAFAHRLDEYLQATLVSLEKDHVKVFMRLVPGVAVSASILAAINADKEDTISEHKQRAYAEQVLRDLSLSVDGISLKPKLASVDFPSLEAIKEGTGEIQIEFSADLPPAEGRDRKLALRNHHQARISAYLVNCLVPQDRYMRIISQNRNRDQSFYELNFIQEGAVVRGQNASVFSGARVWFGPFAVLTLLAFALVCAKPITRAFAQRPAKLTRY